MVEEIATLCILMGVFITFVPFYIYCMEQDLKK